MKKPNPKKLNLLLKVTYLNGNRYDSPLKTHYIKIVEI